MSTSNSPVQAEGSHRDSQSSQLGLSQACAGNCGACDTPLTCALHPQLLPCLHSLCAACAPPAATRDAECPSCRRPYETAEVRDHPFLKELTPPSGAAEVSKCAGCEELTVSGWCVECGEALCSVCVSAHQRVRVTRDHTVLPQRLPKDSAPTVFCPIHKEEPVKLFCVSCNQLTCRDCQLSHHKNHRYQFLSEAVTSQREEIKSLVERVKWQKETLEKSLLDLNGRLKDLTEMKSRLNEEVQQVFCNIHQALAKRAAMLLKDTEIRCTSEVDVVTKRQAVLRKLWERQNHLLTFTNQALGMQDHLALLSSKRQIQRELEEVLSHNALPPASMTDVKIHFDKDVGNHIAKIGNIITKEVPFFCLDAESRSHIRSVYTEPSTSRLKTSFPPIIHVVQIPPPGCASEPSQRYHLPKKPLSHPPALTSQPPTQTPATAESDERVGDRLDLPVKALADSQCERSPPAGYKRSLPANAAVQAEENEPTSTVAESESASPAEESVYATPPMTATGVSLERAAGLFGPSEDEHTAQQAPLVLGSKDGGEPFVKPEQDQSHRPQEGDQLTVPSPCKKPKTAAVPPETTTNTLSHEACRTSCGESQEAVRTTGINTLLSVSTQEQKREGPAGFAELGEPSCRSRVPRVSLSRLPISMPRPGEPLPQFRLLPASSEQSIKLQVLEDESPSPSVGCIVCQTAGQLHTCEACGRRFHGDCHLPPISSTPCREWKCLLCWDLSDNEDPYCSERKRKPSLSLVDQKKCEYLLLSLMCKKCSSILYHVRQRSCHYIDMALIRGRLLRGLSPAYRTPSEFVSDVWVFLDSLMMTSLEPRLVGKLQKSFQKKLSVVFRKTLHPSLLICPASKEPGHLSRQWTEEGTFQRCATEESWDCAVV